MMFKKSVAATLAAVVIAGSVSTIPAQAAPSKDLRMIPIIVNGMKVKFPDTEPYINTDGFTMVPIRFVSEKLGAEVKWNNTTQTASIEYKGQQIAMSIGSNKAIVDGETIMLDTMAEKFEGRTMVPLRFVSEVLDSDVKWDAAARSVRVTDADYQKKVASGQVVLDPWGREYSKVWSKYWMKLTDLEAYGFYAAYNGETPPSKELLNRSKSEKWDYKTYADQWGAKIRNYYAAQLNVDYRTINEASFTKALMDNMAIYGDYEMANTKRVIKDYVAWVKKNKVIAKGYASPELSQAYISEAKTRIWIPTNFKFMVVSANDSAQIFLDNWDVSDGSDSFKLKKGVWYEGYADVHLDTNYGNYQHRHYAVRSNENMFMKGQYHYSVIQ